MKNRDADKQILFLDSCMKTTFYGDDLILWVGGWMDEIVVDEVDP